MQLFAMLRFGLSRKNHAQAAKCKKTTKHHKTRRKKVVKCFVKKWQKVA